MEISYIFLDNTLTVATSIVLYMTTPCIVSEIIFLIIRPIFTSPVNLDARLEAPDYMQRPRKCQLRGVPLGSNRNVGARPHSPAFQGKLVRDRPKWIGGRARAAAISLERRP
ncbi:hypothetical protein PWG15_26855 (plasmid) [Ensifer adhaerens]|uniref:hypothetical protein n=1 Tax=Ensifer adhaerens TaxID=106592 RepID=UPI0023A9F61A|nr:hypothetical protein [Ensifer adhaerens]WDZ79108.1 hypothetical protein PWG15_26855 [Ensifer adhaerens]